MQLAFGCNLAAAHRRQAAVTDRKAQLDGVALASVLACCVVWGVGQVAAKVGVSEVPPLLQAGARSLGAALLVAAWARLRGIRLFHADRTLAGGLVAGSLFAAEFGCIFVGLQYTTASRMAVFLYLAPFVVALGMPWIARTERLGALQWAGLLLAFGGVAWAFAEGFTHTVATPGQLIGDALGVTAALLWGATTLVIRGSRLATASAEKTLLYQLAVSGLALCVAGAVAGERWPLQLSPLVVSSLLFQIAVVSFASYLLWFWLIRHYPATRLAAYTLLTPVFGLVAGAWWLAEPVTTRLLTALATVAFGIYAVNRPRVPVGAQPSSLRTPGGGATH
jgi:drug/metabolite transporter (DMT)-like permease